MQSAGNQIFEYIKKKKRGKIFFAEDFKHFGTAENVRFVLFSLCKKNILIRLATGIYYYPKIDKELELLLAGTGTVTIYWGDGKNKKGTLKSNEMRDKTATLEIQKEEVREVFQPGKIFKSKVEIYV